MVSKIQLSSLLFAFFFLSTVFLSATESPEASLVIVGPGDPVYTYWGHIGIAINDPESGTDLFYDFGNFSFHSESFYGDFALGRMLYLGLVMPTERFISYSLLEDRDLVLYPLNLEEHEIKLLQKRLQWWVMPENREYLYDYFRDNCSTIIRDVLDEAIDGDLKDATQNRQRDEDFRHYARTGANPSLAAEVMLHFLLGPLQDIPLNDWELMFLPQIVAEIAQEEIFPSSNGSMRSLLGKAQILRASTRPPVPSEPGRLWPFMLILGILVSALWICAGKSSPRRKGLHKVSLSLRVFIIAFVGIPGLILSFLMLFTDHVSAYNNINLGPTFPTLLLGLIPLIRSHKKEKEEKEKEEKWLALIWTGNLAGLLLVMILRAAGITIQDAYAFWAFYTPIILSASLPGWLLKRKIAAGLPGLGR